MANKYIDYSRDEILPGEVFTQKRTITSWINYMLRNRGIKINNLRQDLKDGLVVINLLEVLSGKTIGGYSKKPRIQAQLMRNSAQAITSIKELIKLRTTIAPDDFLVGNLKPLLDLMWDLIEHYHVKKVPTSSTHPRAALLVWLQERLDSQYGCFPKNLSSDWADGSILYALTDSLNKGKLQYKSRSGDPLADTIKAMEFASTNYGIPMLVDPQDFISAPNDYAFMIYLAYFQQYSEGLFPVVDNFVDTKWYAEQAPKPNPPVELLKPKVLKFDVKPEPEAPPIPKTVAVDPAQCQVNFPSFVQNSTGKISIIVKDSNGNLTSFYEKLEVIITYANGTKIPCEIKSQNEGELYVTFLGTKLGNILAIVKINNIEIPGSPFTAYCTPGFELDCSVSGSGLQSAFERSYASFLVQTFQNNQPFTVPPDALHVEIAGRETIIPTILSIAPGILQVTYMPFKRGQYTLQISLFGKIVSQNRLISVALDSIQEPVQEPSVKTYNVQGLQRNYVQNVPFSFRVVPAGAGMEDGDLTAYGFAFGGKGGKEEFPVDVVNVGNGEFVVIVVPLTTGTVDIDVTIGNVPLVGSPFDVEIVGK